MRQLLHIYQGGGGLCWHTTPSPHLETLTLCTASVLDEKSLMPELMLEHPWDAGAAICCQRGSSAKSCNTPVCGESKNLFQPTLVYISQSLWIKKRLCLNTYIYILPLPTHTPEGAMPPLHDCPSDERCCVNAACWPLGSVQCRQPEDQQQNRAGVTACTAASRSQAVAVGAET